MYPTDMTNSQWEVMEDILNDQRKRKYSFRSIIDGIFYLKKTGCQWRLLPKEYPPYESCYYYFRKWKNDGTWKMINKSVVELFRVKQNRSASPSVGMVDSQSVKCSEWGGEAKGFDGQKKVKGRKRHIIVDTLGCILAVVVHAANQHDSKGAVPLFKELFVQRYNRMVKIIGDKAYRGDIRTIAAIFYGWVIEVFELAQLKPELEQPKKFIPIPQRWKVERTFAWCHWDRRLSKDFEKSTTSSESMIYVANIHRLIRKF